MGHPVAELPSVALGISEPPKKLRILKKKNYNFGFPLNFLGNMVQPFTNILIYKYMNMSEELYLKPMVNPTFMIRTF